MLLSMGRLPSEQIGLPFYCFMLPSLSTNYAVIYLTCKYIILGAVNKYYKQSERPLVVHG